MRINRSIYFHILFWLFITLYVFDYLVDVYPFTQSVIYTTFEVSIFAAEFYFNLLFLIPFVLRRKRIFIYFLSLISLLLIGFSFYLITGLNTKLLSDNFSRSVISFFLNHGLFLFISFIVSFYNSYFEERNKSQQLELEIQNLEQSAKSANDPNIENNAIVIKSSHQLIRISLSDILYIEGLHKYIKIVTVDDTHTTLYSMTAIEKELPADLFYRCHRSFIININKIDKIEGNQAMISTANIPISKANRSELISKLGKKIG